jgi:mycothiol synthase
MQPAPFDVVAVDRFLEEVSAADGHPPLSGHKLSVIGRGQDRTGVWSDEEGVCLVGVAAHHDGDGHWAVEAAVAARRRDRADEETAIGHAVGLVPPDDPHTLWAFRAGQVEAANRLGYVATRSVLRMAAPITDVARVPVLGITITSMVAEDLSTIVEINNRAFADHREQSGMTPDALRRVVQAGGVGADGVLVAREGSRVRGFCVTKQEGNGAGEVYLLAVDPDSAGMGYGSMLASAGYEWLAGRGATTAVVWVDEGNEKARGVYRRLGLVEDFRSREMTPATG